METEFIPSAAWGEFLTSFSRAHRGWLITVESARADGGTIRQLHGVPLVGVFSESGQLVIAAEREQQRVERVLEQPVSLLRRYTSNGASVGLDIDTAKGEHVTLRFRSAIPTELVDGI